MDSRGLRSLCGDAPPALGSEDSIQLDLTVETIPARGYSRVPRLSCTDLEGDLTLHSAILNYEIRHLFSFFFWQSSV